MTGSQRGLFITFEGGEGGGKSTQISLVAEAFRKAGREVVITREPGGTEAAERIRALILDPSLKGIAPLAELFLYEASRADHVLRRIEPALASGAVVLSDRFADSSLVYQGAARNLQPSVVAQLNKIATGGLKPKLTFIFDLAPEAGFARLQRRGALDRMESEGLAFHRRVRRGYRELWRRDPRRCVLVRASDPAAKITQRILGELARRNLL